MLALDFNEDDLPLEGNEEVKLYPEETIKSNIRKRKNSRNRIFLTAI